MTKEQVRAQRSKAIDTAHRTITLILNNGPVPEAHRQSLEGAWKELQKAKDYDLRWLAEQKS